MVENYCENSNKFYDLTKHGYQNGIQGQSQKHWESANDIDI